MNDNMLIGEQKIYQYEIGGKKCTVQFVRNKDEELFSVKNWDWSEFIKDKLLLLRHERDLCNAVEETLKELNK